MAAAMTMPHTLAHMLPCRPELCGPELCGYVGVRSGKSGAAQGVGDHLFRRHGAALLVGMREPFVAQRRPGGCHVSVMPFLEHRPDGSSARRPYRVGCSEEPRRQLCLALAGRHPG